MGIAERREREREALRARIVDTARDILSEEGLSALSIRGIAERIEYAPATIYLYFRDKDELVRAVVSRGVDELERYLREALAALPEGTSGREMHRSLARGYVRFAVENTAYFRVIFELPGVPRLVGDSPEGAGVSIAEERPFRLGAGVLRRAIAEREYDIPGGAEEGALVGWSMVHGLVTLYLSGHFGSAAPDADSLETLLDSALGSLYRGWRVSG